MGIVGLCYYGFTQSGYPPVDGFGVFSIVMAVTFAVFSWYFCLKNWEKLSRKRNEP